jgi:4a-hydroxytetrahydrobiopterin dehydratase
MPKLIEKRSAELPKGTPALSDSEVKALLAEVPGWEVIADGKRLAKTYTFKNFYETTAFASAAFWIIHREDHHPDLEVSYKTARFTFWTHTVGGLSENDFITAAKIDALPH